MLIDFGLMGMYDIINIIYTNFMANDAHDSSNRANHLSIGGVNETCQLSHGLCHAHSWPIGINRLISQLGACLRHWVCCHEHSQCVSSTDLLSSGGNPEGLVWLITGTSYIDTKCEVIILWYIAIIAVSISIIFQ